MKQCSRCKLEKPFSEFYVSHNSKSGYRSRCKSCDKLGAIEWNSSHPKEISISHSKYYLNHKEEMNQKSKKINKEWYIKNKEEKDRKNREWRNAHRKEMCEYVKERVRNNPQEQLRRKIYGLQWFRNNPDKHKAYSIKRRTLKLGNGGSFTEQEWKDLKEFYGNKCLRCGKENTKLTADHITPLKLGGTSYINNIQPLCHSCNSKKHLEIIDYRNGIIPDWIDNGFTILEMP